MESKGTPRSRSPTRMVKRVKSKSQASDSRRPSREESKLRALSRGRSASQKDPLNRSTSNGRRPSREDSKLRALSRSRGRSGRCRTAFRCSYLRGRRQGVHQGWSIRRSQGLYRRWC